MKKAMEQTVVGDPFEKETEMGPMVSRAQMESVDRAVQTAVAEGAELQCGGKKYSDRKGYFYSPTVLTHCRQDSQVMQQEVFGPVLPITTFKDLDEAIEDANDCQYGLTSSDLHAQPGRGDACLQRNQIWRNLCQSRKF